MMRLFLTLTTVLALTLPGSAQLQGGSLAGRVHDEQGNVLPGATVRLRGPGARHDFVTGEDGIYLFRDVPPGTFTLAFGLEGFTTVVHEGVVVLVGAHIDLPVVLPLGGVAESVTVTGEAPLVDTRSFGTATNLTWHELSRVPNSRDPWAILRTIPGVVLDRVNIAGNETGQQSQLVSKGAPQRDTVWTLDGVQITDMAAAAQAPSYFDYDAFEEIRVATSGSDIRQPGGGVGLNLVVRRGTNEIRGTARGYYTGSGLEASNVPAELRARGITPTLADHNDQITDLGFDAGGPVIRDRLFFWGGWSEQDIRLIRQQGISDRTILKTHNLKVNYQISPTDSFSFLLYNGNKVKRGRAPGFALFEPQSARWNQTNHYPDNPFHGLWKFEQARSFSSNLHVSGRYAYLGTGFALDPAGGLDQGMTVSPMSGRTFGTTFGQYFLRPQHTATVDASHFRSWRGSGHDLRMGLGWRRTDAGARVAWPGGMLVGIEVAPTGGFAQVYREGAGTNRAEFVHLYVGDTITRGRLTLDVGARYDRQWGRALPSDIRGNVTFPELVPGVRFAGYRAPFTWQNLTPRFGLTWALDRSSRTLLRASAGRYAGQLSGLTQYVGFSNPTTASGFAMYQWTDVNRDHLVQPDEINLAAGLLGFGGGFNPAQSALASSANVIDPDLRAPVTTGVVVGVDREVGPDLALGVAYTYTRTTDHTYVPWLGTDPDDYLPGPVVTGLLPDGREYRVQTSVPDAARVAVGGNGRFLTNYADYFTTYRGIEVSVVKRLSNRWMMRAAVAYNDPRNHFTGPRPVNSNGNPTPLDGFSSVANPAQAADPLKDGGTLAPSSIGGGSGEVFMSARWQTNVNSVYEFPFGIEAAGNLFARQGTPYPIVHPATLGLDGPQNVLVAPDLDEFRFDSLWNLDLRLAKRVRRDGLTVQVIGDLFNVFNTNTELSRERNVLSPNFQVLRVNLSPRILRLGVRLGF